MPSLSTTAVPKLVAILDAWVASGQERRTISRVAPLRSCDDLALERLGVEGLAMSVPSLVAKRFRPVPVCPSMRALKNRQRTGGFTGPIRLSQQGRVAGQQVLT